MWMFIHASKCRSYKWECVGYMHCCMWMCVCALRGGYTALSHAAGIEQRVGECAYHCSKWGKKEKRGKKKCCESCWGTQKKGERKSLLSLIRVSASLSLLLEKQSINPVFSLLLCLFCSHQIFFIVQLHMHPPQFCHILCSLCHPICLSKGQSGIAALSFQLVSSAFVSKLNLTDVALSKFNPGVSAGSLLHLFKTTCLHKSRNTRKCTHENHSWVFQNLLTTKYSISVGLSLPLHGGSSFCQLTKFTTVRMLFNFHSHHYKKASQLLKFSLLNAVYCMFM